MTERATDAHGEKDSRMSAPAHQAHYALRDELLAGLRSDLMGPLAGETELLTDDAPITASGKARGGR